MKNNKRLIVAMLITLITILTAGAFIANASYMKTQFGASIHESYSQIINGKSWAYMQKTTPNVKNTLTTEDYENNQYDLFIFFKINCIYCETAHPYIQEQLDKQSEQQQSRIVYVNTESDIGKKLVDEYGIMKAASMVDTHTGTVYDQVTTTKTGKININTNAIDTAFTKSKIKKAGD